MIQFYKLFSLRKKRKSLFKNALLGIGIFLGNSNSIEAQVSTYSFAKSSGTYTSVSGTVLGTATDNTANYLNSDIYPITLPFNFNFNGVSHSSLNVSTNGFITFGSTPPTATTTSPISSSTAFDGVISAWGRDISSFFDVNGVSGELSWAVLGSAPNREVVIQWKNFRPNSSSAITNVYAFSFQIRLEETSNVVKVIYDGGSYLAGSTAVGLTAQIGLRGATNADYNNRLNSTSLEFVNSTSGTANSSAQNFNTVNTVPGMPTAGLTYTWTPPTCYSTTGLTAGTSTSDSVGISWTGSVSSPGGYDIYYSTSSTVPTASTTPNLINVPGTSATLSPLAPSTVYFVWIRSNCGSGNTSVWSPAPLQVSTICLPPAVLSTNGATVCPGQAATLSAAAASGATLTWYDAATGGTVLGTGTSYTTPALVNTTPYYVSASTESTSTAGLINAISTTGYTLEAGVFFDAYTAMTINGVYVYPTGTGAGTAVIALQDGNTTPATTLQSVTVNLTGTAAPHVKTFVPLNFNVPQGSNYKLMMLSRTGSVSGLIRESGWGSYPLTIPGVMSITNGNCCSANATSTAYYYFYDWQITSKCESTRSTVTATVDAGCLSTSELDVKDQMKVYPNPFKDVITIANIEKVKSIQVLDASGRTVKTIDSLSSKELYLGDLKSGLYILNLIMKDGSINNVKAIKK